MRVGVLGSCRVDTPLLEAGKRGEIDFSRVGSFKFMHSPREMVQAAEIMAGALPLPEPWLRSITGLADPAPLIGRKLQDHMDHLDLVVVEISSIHEVEFGGYALQINMLRDYLKAFPNGPDLLTGLKYFDQRWETARAAGMVAAGVTERGAQLLSGISHWRQNEVSVAAELRKLARMLQKPILFVSHFAEDYAGNAIPARDTIRQALARVTATVENVSWFDPTPHIALAGRQNALKDLGHYQPDFESKLSYLLAEAAKAAA